MCVCACACVCVQVQKVTFGGREEGDVLTSKEFWNAFDTNTFPGPACDNRRKWM